MNEISLDLAQIRKQLLADYTKWWEETKQLGFVDEKYSNPYYCGIPNNWRNNSMRIMICGEEGYGSWNKDNLKGDDIIDLQQHNLEYVNGERISGNVTTNYRSQFWKRFKQIQFLDASLSIAGTKDKKSPTSVSVIWNNCDKICNLTRQKCSGRLLVKERKLLHSVSVNILRKEIEITKPTHIVFLGWYGLSLETNQLNLYSRYHKAQNKYNYPLDIHTIDSAGNKMKLYYLYHPAIRNNRDLYAIDIEITIQDIKDDLNKTKYNEYNGKLLNV